MLNDFLHNCTLSTWIVDEVHLRFFRISFAFSVLSLLFQGQQSAVVPRLALGGWFYWEPIALSTYQGLIKQHRGGLRSR